MTLQENKIDLQSMYQQKLEAAKAYLGTRYQLHPEFIPSRNIPRISDAHLQHKWAVKRTYQGHQHE